VKRAVAVTVLLVTISCSRKPEQAPATGSAESPSTTSSSLVKPSAPVIAPEIRAQVESLAGVGAQVYRRITKRYPNTELYLGGGIDSRVWLEFAIPRKAWSSLNQRERVALSYFIEGQIPVVRENPALYSLTPVSAPIWPRFEANYRGICETCWTISTGPYAPDRGVSPEDTLLAGDGLWVWFDTGDPEVRSSVFRQKVLKVVLPELTWKVQLGDPAKIAAIAAATAEREQFRQAGEDLWVGVRLYSAPANDAFTGEVLGGNRRYYASVLGETIDGVKIRFESGSMEWKLRSTAATYYIRRDDPKISDRTWKEYRE
jgi:hypothetical protein